MKGLNVALVSIAVFSMACSQEEQRIEERLTSAQSHVECQDDNVLVVVHIYLDDDIPGLQRVLVRRTSYQHEVDDFLYVGIAPHDLRFNLGEEVKLCHVSYPGNAMASSYFFQIRKLE